MKKLFVATIIICVVVCSSLLVCCNKQQSLQVYAPDGAPSLAVAKLFGDKKLGGYNLDCQVVAGVDIRSKVISGEADIAVLPTNMAVSLYNSGCNYTMVSVNVWGVLYLVGSESVTNLSDLVGKVVYSIGLANTPEYVFKGILQHNGIAYQEHDANHPSDDKVMIDYSLTDGSKIIPKLLRGEIQYAILGEPAVTTAIAKCQQNGVTLFNLFDLQSLYQQVYQSIYPTQQSVTGYPQACVMVKNSLAQDGQFMQTLLNSLQSNNQYVLDNVDNLGDILDTQTQYTAQVVQKCNITMRHASNVKQQVETYLDVINAIAGTNIAKPNDNFYYLIED